jgi:hypothetical protein
MTAAVRRGEWLFVVCAWLGCADDPRANPSPDQGSGGGGGDATSCFDPDDPAIHYVSEDHATCRSLELDCEADQFGFDNACGCGCVDKGELSCPHPDDPLITYVSRDPDACAPENPECPLGELPFNNSCGCGCLAR